MRGRPGFRAAGVFGASTAAAGAPSRAPNWARSSADMSASCSSSDFCAGASTRVTSPPGNVMPPCWMAWTNASVIAAITEDWGRLPVAFGELVGADLVRGQGHPGGVA